MVRSSVSCGGAYSTIAHAILQEQCHYKSCVFSIRYALVHTGTKYMISTHVHSLYKQNSSLIISFGFRFLQLLRRHWKTFNINAEKPKFYFSAVLHFTMADLLETNKVQEARFRFFSLNHFDPFCFCLF